MTYIFKGLRIVGIPPYWKQALCMWMNFNYLRGNFVFWKNILIQSFDLKISIQNTILNVLPTDEKNMEKEKKIKKEEKRKDY